MSELNNWVYTTSLKTILNLMFNLMGLFSRGQIFVNESFFIDFKH